MVDSNTTFYRSWYEEYLLWLSKSPYRVTIPLIFFFLICLRKGKEKGKKREKKSQLNSLQLKNELDENGRPKSRAEFYAWLEEFLEGEGTPFRGDVVYLANSSTFIRATRIHSSFIILDEAIDEVITSRHLIPFCSLINSLI